MQVWQIHESNNREKNCYIINSAGRRWSLRSNSLYKLVRFLQIHLKQVLCGTAVFSKLLPCPDSFADSKELRKDKAKWTRCTVHVATGTRPAVQLCKAQCTTKMWVLNTHILPLKVWKYKPFSFFPWFLSISLSRLVTVFFISYLISF